jgi:RimJ/RimL family protein N-acetyltransferase
MPALHASAAGSPARIRDGWSSRSRSTGCPAPREDLPVPLDLTTVDLPTEVVRTERLVLRPYSPADVDPVFRACQDPDTMRWLTALPAPYTRAAAEEFVTGVAVQTRAEGRAMMTALEADGQFVGSSGIHRLADDPRLGPEIGYWIAPWARGRGYAAEASAALADWAFGLGATRVHLFADVGNAPSQAVARKAGFAQEGVVRACLPYRDGSHGDAVLFGKLRGAAR